MKIAAEIAQVSRIIMFNNIVDYVLNSIYYSDLIVWLTYNYVLTVQDFATRSLSDNALGFDDTVTADDDLAPFQIRKRWELRCVSI